MFSHMALLIQIICVNMCVVATAYATAPEDPTVTKIK